MQAYPGIIVSTYIPNLRDESYTVPVRVNMDKPEEDAIYSNTSKHIHPYSDAIIVLPETAFYVSFFLFFGVE